MTEAGGERAALRVTDEALRAAVLRRLDRRIALSRLALLWERLWPALVLPGSVVALFCAVAWFGLWAMLGETGRIVGLALFGVTLLLACLPLARVLPPTRAEAIARLDRLGGVPDRAAAALADRLPEAADAASRALWRLHRERELARIDAARVARPRPGLAWRDPYQLRHAVLLVALVGFVYAGGAVERVTGAFRGTPPPPPVPARIDAWVTPPAYTGRPPLFLSVDAESRESRVPQGSVVTIRADRSEGLLVTLDGAQIEGESEIAGAASGPRLFRMALARDAVVKLAQDGQPARAFPFSVEPDRPPTVALDGQIRQTIGGSLRVFHKVEDDYGVVTGEARLSPIPDTATPAPARLGLRAAPREARPLYDAPAFPLTFARARPRSASGATTRDLTNHPWAGGRARLALVVTDDAGQEGRSDEVTIELPQRRFEKPLARAVIEQRRTLAMDANAREGVAAALDLLALDPERRIPETKVYLNLRVGYHRLLAARSDDDLRAVVDHLWETALLIEDGDLSDAERALRAARERLEQAIERGASPEEIRRLMEELRQAMNEVAREMMRQAQREGRRPPEPRGNERVIRQQDIERLMREIEDLMRSGNRDAARSLMSQLRDMLEAMRNAQPTMQGQNGERDQALDELGNMIREQQRLMDRTFRQRQQQGQQRQGQRQPGQRQPGQGQEQGGEDPSLGELQQGQSDLRQQLQRFLEALRQGGQEPGGELGEAEGQMGQAEGELGRGSPGGALGPQNRALDNLRRGAQRMARGMMGQGDPDQDGQPGGPNAQAGNQSPGDPLQRDLPNVGEGGDVRIPGQADRQRTQEILDMVRRRLADPARPPIELDYLQRLLQPF